MNQVVLDKVRLGCRIPMDAQIWTDMSVDVVQAMDFMADQIIFQFESTVFKEKLPPQTISKTVEFTKPVTIEVMVPRSPWQFWKENHRAGKWIGWLVRLFPEPEYETLSHTKVVRHSEEVSVDLHHSVIYPEAKGIACPQLGSTTIRWVEPVWK
jgi:hypothetical protein